MNRRKFIKFGMLSVPAMYLSPGMVGESKAGDIEPPPTGEPETPRTSYCATHYRELEDENQKLCVQLAQAARMEAMGLLLYGVARDLDNVLSCMVEHAETALREVGPAEPIHPRLQEIHSIAAFSSDMVRQALTYGNSIEESKRYMGSDRHRGLCDLSS